MSAGSLLEVRNLAKKFGGVRALDDVSFDVSRGDVLGIVQIQSRAQRCRIAAKGSSRKTAAKAVASASITSSADSPRPSSGPMGWRRASLSRAITSRKRAKCQKKGASSETGRIS